MGFIERHGLWSDEQRSAATEVLGRATAGEFDTVRLSFADQHGSLRGKTLVADECAGALRSGCSMTSTLLLKDTAHRTVFPVFTSGGGMGLKELEGAADILMVPAPTTFRLLPWAPRTAWMLCDLYYRDGRPIPFSTRSVLRDATRELGRRGLDHVTGLEVEFHVFKLADPAIRADCAGQPGEAPEVVLLSQGYQYLTEHRYDQVEPIMELLRSNIAALGLPLRSLEVEFGPSQCEFTFRPQTAMRSADDMVLFRSAVKQVCRRNGYHATFMCRPRIPNVVSSGWHLHQSLVDRGGRNLMMPSDGERGPLSDLGMAFLAGLVEHARDGAVFSTPTINGYKRYRAYSLAPDRANWGCDNRGVMLRVLGGGDDPASRIENRVGEPLANPYLYMASQILAGLDGIDRKLNPGASADEPYETPAPMLPKSLREALMTLDGSDFFRRALGDAFVDYYIQIKRGELDRFQAEVTDWEHREYFTDY